MVSMNGKNVQAEAEPDDLLLDLVRSLGCYSVKRGCETANCGLCTVLVDGKSVLSCSMLAARVNDRDVVTLEGVQKEAEEFGMYLAGEGAEQCGFCSPGLIMNVLAMEKELNHPGEDEIKEGVVACKDMKSGEQTKLNTQETIDRIKAGLAELEKGSVIVE